MKPLTYRAHGGAKSRLRIAAALGSLILVSACGSGSSTDGDSSGEGVAKADKAVIAYASPVTTLDPNSAVLYADTAVAHLIAGNLYETRPDGTIVPGLATSGDVSADGLTWTFKLRDGEKFSDGTPLTSADVKATIERSKANPAFVFPSFVERISSVDASDPTTVTIQTSAPYPSLPSILATPFMMILPKDALGDASFYDSPISAGPYELVSWGHTPTVKLKLNPNYSGARPLLKTIDVVTVPDAATRLAQVKSGQIDYATYLPPSLIDQVTSPTVLNVSQDFGFNTLTMRNTSKPLDEVGVRRGISLAIDRKQIASVVWADKVTPSSQFWPSSMDGYDESISSDQDLAAAKQALSGTGCESGCSLKLLVDTSIEFDQLEAQIIQQNLGEIGIEVAIQAVDNTTFYSKLGGGDYDLALSVQFDFVNAPDGILTYSLLSGTGYQANFSGYESQEMDAAIKAVVEAPQSDRTAPLAEVNRIFGDDVPFATLHNWVEVSASSLSPDLIRIGSSDQPEIGRADGS